MSSFPPDPNLPGPAAIGEPEILPPGAQYVPPPVQEPVRRRRRFNWAEAPATYTLVGLNCAVFLAMVARGISPASPGVDQLMRWGANNAGNVLVYGQWWRIITAMF